MNTEGSGNDRGRRETQSGGKDLRIGRGNRGNGTGSRESSGLGVLVGCDSGFSNDGKSVVEGMRANRRRPDPRKDSRSILTLVVK